MAPQSPIICCSVEALIPEVCVCVCPRVLERAPMQRHFKTYVDVLQQDREKNHTQVKALKDEQTSETKWYREKSEASLGHRVLQSDSSGSCVTSWIIQAACVNDTIYVCLTELAVSLVTVRLCQQVGSDYPFTSPLWRPRPLSQECETSCWAKASETWAGSVPSRAEEAAFGGAKC